jgi:hypothetical protein
MSSKLKSSVSKESQANSKQVEPRVASGETQRLKRKLDVAHTKSISSAANNRAVS